MKKTGMGMESRNYALHKCASILVIFEEKPYVTGTHFDSVYYYFTELFWGIDSRELPIHLVSSIQSANYSPFSPHELEMAVH